MGLALSNPNDKRRLNAAARAVVKQGASVNDVVQMIKSGKSAMAIKKAYGIYTPKGQKGERLAAALAASPQTKAKKREYAATKAKIARALDGLDYGRTHVTKGKRGRKRVSTYSRRVLGTHAGRYRVKAKKTTSRKSSTGKTLRGRRVDVSGARRYNDARMTRRKAHPGVTAGKIDGTFANALVTGKLSKGRKTTSGRKAGGGGGLEMYQMALAQIKSTGVTHAEARQLLADGKRKGMSPQDVAGQFVGSLAAANPGVFGGLALSNPGVFGGLALSNPGYKSLAMKAGVATVGAAAGAYVHAKAVPWVSENVYARIPYAGEYLQEYAYASTGVLAGALLGGVAAAVGGQAGLYIGLLAGGVAAAGGALQVADMTGMLGESDLDLDLNEDELEAEMSEDMSGVFGGIAMDNSGVFGGIAMDNYGDGMAYEIGGFSSPFDEAASAYGSAELADAQHAGADLDVAEGQAACAGPREWLNRFGHPPHRAHAMGGSPGASSHLAGRSGHRWGWLIKLIGFKKFQRLASLPPKQRLATIKKMRRAAIITMKREMKSQLPPANPEFVSGQTAQTAHGVDASYAGMLFSGHSAM